MVWARDEKVRFQVPWSDGRVETQRKETKRTSKEEIYRWNKARLLDIRDTELAGTKNTKYRRVEGGIGGCNNS